MQKRKTPSKNVQIINSNRPITRYVTTQGTNFDALKYKDKSSTSSTKVNFFQASDELELAEKAEEKIPLQKKNDC